MPYSVTKMKQFNLICVKAQVFTVEKSSGTHIYITRDLVSSTYILKRVGRWKGL